MSYAGITKGLTGLAAAMMLAATRFGAAPSLAAELADSQPELLTWFKRQVPGDVHEGLSLGRRDGGDRGPSPARMLQRGRSTPGSPRYTSNWRRIMPG